jgi:chromosome segregation ATPase
MATTEVEQATQTLSDLQDQRDACVGRAAKLAADRRALSYAAHAGANKDAQARLRKLNDQTILQSAELENLDSAIVEAASRLETAKTAEAGALDRANAEALRIKLSRFTELALNLDDCLQDFLSTANEMDEVLAEMRSLGTANPSDAQMRVLATFCLKSFVMQTPWTAREWEHLPPGQRKSFKDLAVGWHTMIEAGINARLGLEPEQADKTKEVAA